MDKGRLLDGLKNGVHTVLHRQDEAGRKLPEGTPCVHQGGGIGEEFERSHHVVKFRFHRFQIGLLIKIPIRGGNGRRHPVEEILHRFGDFPFVVADEVTPLQHRAGVLRDVHKAFPSFQRLAVPRGKNSIYGNFFISTALYIV